MFTRITIRLILLALLLAGSLALTQSAPQNQAAQSTPQPATEPPPPNPSPYWDESVKLNQMAVELQTHVNKSTKDQLALDVIRKADDIERFAHSIKQHMRGEGAAQ